jgi:hypothetical protein
MTDQWVPGPPPAPTQPPTGLPPTDTWVEAEPCATDSSGGLTSIVDNITITGAPGSITSVANDQALWSIVLNDGTSSGDFRIDRYQSGVKIDSPIYIARADGTVTFADPVMLGEDPTQPLQAATKEYVDNSLPVASTATPLMDGTAAPGSAAAWSRGDHVHPTDTSRYAASNPAGYVTSAGAAAAAPVQSVATRTGAVTLTHADITDWAASLAPYAPLASPALTGVPTAPTAAPATNTTQLATTAFVAAALSGSVAGVSSFNTRTGAVTLSSADVTGALGFTPYNTTNPAGYQTAAQVTASLAPYALTSAVPVASSTTPVMDGTAAVGIGTTWARADHVHPTDTSRYAASNPSGYQTAAQVTASLANYLPLTGGTLTGQLTVPALSAPQAMGDNRIINGDMRIDQRNNGASGTATTTYTVDRWYYGANQAAKGTWQRGSGPMVFGVPYCLSFVSSSAYVALATDNFRFEQSIEADMVSDFAWGTSGAQPVTLSFYVLSSLTGTFSGVICNYTTVTRSYPFTFSIPTATTWQKVVINITGYTVGTWVMSGNGGALYIRFDLGSGANFRGPANAWASANYTGATGAQSVVATNGALLNITGVKLEVGNVATPFNRQSLAKSMADCQRYYNAMNRIYVNPASLPAASAFAQTITMPTTMRAAPTITLANVTYSNASGLATQQVTPGSFNAYANGTTAGVAWSLADYLLSAEL